MTPPHTLHQEPEKNANRSKTFSISSSLPLSPLPCNSSQAVLDEDHSGRLDKKEFLRAPNLYGFTTISFVGPKNLVASINMVNSGPMLIAHFDGAPEQKSNEYKKTTSFTELGFKVGYTYKILKNKTGIELFGGIKNFTNAYQNDFDTGKNRDSNYIYGPAAPRTFFIGLKLKDL